MLIDFACTDVFGLIVSEKTGIRFTTQTGGMCCNHPEAEGFYVPFNGAWHNQFTDEMHKLVCDMYLKGADWDKVDELLKGYHLRVDRSKAEEAQEAWIPVIIGNEYGEFDPLYRCGGMRAWLIYGNCD